MKQTRRTSFLALLFVTLFFIHPHPAPAISNPESIERVSPEQAKKNLDSGEALVVCSYDDQRCGQMMIDGAITFSALEQMRPSLAKDREIIFYCG